MSWGATGLEFAQPLSGDELLAHATRLLVRERYSYKRPWARLIVEPTQRSASR